ncbi:MAG: prepilin-type N-terminal cleavage/methylation domain-containing protein [Opitutus sp.]
MIITTTHSSQRRGAFTLVEVMVAATIGSFVLAGVLTAFLLLTRSATNAANYSIMETQSRKALEELGQDLRMAKDATWNSATSITLEIPDNYTSTSNLVTYAYQVSGGVGQFYRMPGAASASNAKTVLVRNVSSDFAFSRFDRIGAPLSSTVPGTVAAASALNIQTKRIQLYMTVRSTSKTVVAATNTILSASFILRNKLTS